MYHISDCKKYNRCHRLFVLEQNREKEPFQSFVRLDDTIADLAAQKLGIRECFRGERNDDPERALAALQNYEWLMRARFEYGGLRIKVPFLHKTEDGFDLYFLYHGMFPRCEDMQFYCDTVWVLEHLNIPLSQFAIIHLNGDYVRGEELDPQQLFIVSPFFYNTRNRPSYSVEAAIRANMRDLSETLRDMTRLSEKNMPEAVRSSRCAGRSRCRFYEDCFPEERSIPDNSILNLTGARYRYDMLKEGIETLRNADLSRIEGSRMQYAEIMADRQGGLFADRAALAAWLSDVVWPVSFLDFEWETFAVPPYEGMKPFMVLPFEYSLHVMEKDGSIRHEVFLSDRDARREMAERLIHDIPEEGTIIAYNAEGAEKLRIQELADRYEDLRPALLSINERMKDLQMPFTSGLVYDVRMGGVWTLKKIMSLMDDRSYQDLDIHHGMEAVFQWRQLNRGDADIDRDKILQELRDYCGMDTYAMTVIFQWLKTLAE